MPTSADHATSSGTSSSSRLRAVTGVFVMLLGSPAAMEAAAAREATAAPAAVHARADLVPTGGLAGALRRSRQRPPGPPDGHLAAVLPRFDRGALAAAMRRACGQPN